MVATTIKKEKEKNYKYDVLQAMKEALKLSKDSTIKKYDNFDEVMEDLDNAL